mmetsp:Transcript_95645/g.189604  ORF Transcript_95645/g.189604 Transcript_95645/m.189604 type:complete len:103 (+) Transcript_95645:56-364(+)
MQPPSLEARLCEFASVSEAMVALQSVHRHFGKLTTSSGAAADSLVSCCSRSTDAGAPACRGITSPEVTVAHHDHGRDAEQLVDALVASYICHLAAAPPKACC